MNDQYVRALPKVELDVQLEGSIRKETLLTIAEQNDMPETFKHFRQWWAKYEKPDHDRLDELIQAVGHWIQQPDDLARLVYELGTSLVKNQVRYAEVGFYPHIYVNNGMTFEQVLAAINDGRARLERGWGIKLNWIICTPRSQPALAEETLRWAASTVAKKAGVIGFGLAGRDMAQPIEEYERFFRTAQKKGLPCSCSVALLQQAVDILKPERLYGAWRMAEEPEGLDALVKAAIPVVVSTAAYAKSDTLPLKDLRKQGVNLLPGTLMPALFETNLQDEYSRFVQQSELTPAQVEEVGLATIRASFLSDEEKQSLSADFKKEYARLRDDYHLS